MDIIRYNDLYKDRMNIFNSYLLFTIFVVLLSLFVSMNITYKKYFLAKAVVNNNGYLKCLVEENSLSLLNKNSTLIIDEVEYQYSISSVEPIVNENNLIYQVELKVNLDSKISKENNDLKINQTPSNLDNIIIVPFLFTINIIPRRIFISPLKRTLPNTVKLSLSIKE